MTTQDPILSAPGTSPVLNLGSSRLVHRIGSDQTDGAFAVVEFVSAPGEGVDRHVHAHEEELVYLLEGEIEVSLGDQTVPVTAGACALLPRGVPHGYVNTGSVESRLLAVLLPGRLDGFFVGLDRELATGGPHEPGLERLCAAFGLSFLDGAEG